MFVGYNGSKYFGSQIQENVNTVEKEIFKALYSSGMVTDSNYEDIKKIAFGRATRTDRGVHALLNLFSAK